MNEEYQEIDLGKLFRVVLSKWWLILLLMCVAGGTAYYVTSEHVTPIYEAKSTLFIGKESDLLAGINLNDLKAENQLIVDYRELIKTRLVTEEVIKDLALVSDYESIVANLTVGSIDESRFMHISFKDHIPARAAQITNYLSKVLTEKAEEIVGVQYVQVVDEAIEPLKPISPSVPRNTAIGAMLGLATALGIIFLMMMLDNTIQTEEDIEKIMSAPVLGMIPEFKGEVRNS